MSTRTLSARRPRDTYFELVRRFPLRPLRCERDLDAATSLMNELVDRVRLDSDEQDYLDVLSDLVEKYEEKHHPIPPPSDADLLAFLIEQKGVTQAEVARGAGLAVSTVSEVLSGKRRIARAHMGALARFFRVSPAVFVADE
ncbi:MAG: helix-turn-helix domain-containing protein [Planctomycetes bacterium]|nr:helix-turn-helix domain-containing protein [Planctomycetota bacterium]